MHTVIDVVEAAPGGPVRRDVRLGHREQPRAAHQQPQAEHRAAPDLPAGSAAHPAPAAAGSGPTMPNRRPADRRGGIDSTPIRIAR